VVRRPKGEYRTAHGRLRLRYGAPALGASGRDVGLAESGLQPWVGVPERIALKGRPSADVIPKENVRRLAIGWQIFANLKRLTLYLKSAHVSQDL
jgi:hypothetical protein